METGHNYYAIIIIIIRVHIPDSTVHVMPEFEVAAIENGSVLIILYTTIMKTAVTIIITRSSFQIISTNVSLRVIILKCIHQKYVDIEMC